MATLLPVRIYSEAGLLALRDGLVFVLFIRKAHEEICTAVVTLYDGYEQLVGSDKLEWVHARGEYYHPYTVRRKARIRQYLRPDIAQKLRNELFTLKGDCGESEPGGFLFRYRGRDMAGRLADVNASFVEMWFPTEFPAAVGWDVFVSALLKLVDTVPFSSGYCSLGFNREDWAVVGTDEFVRARAARHPGMDIHNTMHTAIRIGDGVRGAYWLTFLSHAVLEKLELSPKQLREQLGSEILVHELTNGVAIQAGNQAQPGDRNRRDELPLIRRVATVIEPVQHIQTVGIFGFRDVEDFVNWQRRHLL